ncbi:MAG: metal ABC transporter substrate-binding protein [Anaerolineaceae bacterium]|nr:metal ABC transporter substrate-binding protein [Anaerolineaceae bacterium]
MKKKTNLAFVLVFMLIAILGLSACTAKNATAEIKKTDSAADAQKLNVVATFNAMEELAKAIGKEKVDVITMIPAGMEPHDFEPKPQDLASLSKADVFIYNGLGMESWVKDAMKAANNQTLIVVDTSEGADRIKNSDEETIKEHGQYDPHLWLSLNGAKVQASNIKNAFIKADPAKQAYYEKNYTDFAAAADKLIQEYQEKFSKLTKKSFVTGHAAFGYLCRDFGLQQESVEDIYAEGEPSAQQLAKLVEYSRENKVTTIFAEEMASPEISNTLAKEVGAKVETIYTMEGPEDGLSYLERMETNLSRIYQALSR